MKKLGSWQTKDHIAAMLRTEILSGRMSDGEELAQEQLAERLEVSRMPVREALQVLELEGLLRRLPNRHMQVVGLCERTIYENMQLVAAVEAEIAAMLVKRACPLPDPPSFSADLPFHQWFSDQADNYYLQQTHRRLLSGYPNYIWTHCQTGSFQEQNADIWYAVKNKDITRIHKCIRSYYRDLAREMLQNTKENANEQSEAD